MKRPAVLIVGAVAGALLVAAVGASAHTGFFTAKPAGLHSAVAGQEASSPRVEPAETPEPTETPEATPTAEPAATPEPADNDTETNDDNQAVAPANNHETETGDHESGSGSSSSGGGEHGD
jgi:septal ring-binding cell division protein DamX